MAAHTRFVAILTMVSFLVACAAPQAQPRELTGLARTAPAGASEPADSSRVIEAPVDGTTHPQGTPPGFPTVVVEQVVTDPLVIALLANLHQRGFAPELQDASRVELLQGAPGQAYRLGDGWLHLHVCADAQAAQTTAASIRDAMRHSMNDWVAPPHFFQCNRLIALYLGTDERVIGALGELCALPFYPTDLHTPTPAAAPSPTHPSPQRLRVHNAGTTVIIGLVVGFAVDSRPVDHIAFGDIAPGATTDYQTVPNGVLEYAAYGFQMDGRETDQAVTDFIGEQPLPGMDFTYSVDYDVGRWSQHEAIRLLGVTTDK
jgi:hypothetical protein